MLVLTRSDVEELLDLSELIGALARAHEELSSGAVSMPPRIAAFASEGLLRAMRTAGAAALATRLLARDDARVLAILGTGAQARSHAQMFARVRDWSEIRIVG